ncbi:hypothetical protein JQN72_10180 [Phycicoccus sp. CSK15P-2]|uniref:hypothetical protein n=1 Tax=Phycicoccus sp. CSK15P-2 TaxID=2807627 RepID=UPI00194E1191|nr:hypothetical protein [Phycicoccus sp. CSK15P-2]MBM6404607.1 hypothetical protein [Phycicoccus sp. CSK15P-2]
MPRDLKTLAVDFPLKGASEPPYYEFGSASVCGHHAPGEANFDVSCHEESLYCQSGDPAQGLGPVIAVWVREVVDEDGDPVDGEWEWKGDTCFPQLVPGVAALTMEMIREAFHDTEFTVPTVNIQPEGDVTLVNLPTFFEVQFPEAGHGPGEVDEVDPARMLGRLVQVRPRLKSVTYHLGEQTIGPTTSLGGPYPSGDVTATYARPGEYDVRVDITYTGQYRLGRSGTWIDIPGDVTREGTPTALTVREARSRLYTR